MEKGRFSNNGVDTFRESKQYIGVRLQRGVPLLDRDWNEAEDIRRYFERMLRLNYVGNGVPDDESFRIQPAPKGPANDFLIGAGRCMAQGYDLWNPLERLFSSLPGGPSLPATVDKASFVIYLLPSVTRVTAQEDQHLQNSQDVNLETCVRDRLDWSAAAVRLPALPPADSVPLALIERPAGETKISAAMIQDLRRSPLNVRRIADDNLALTGKVVGLEKRVQDLEVELEKVKTKLAKLFWEVEVTSPDKSVLFGEKVRIDIRVVNGLNEPVISAFVSLTADWGVLSPATAVTDNNGKVSIELIGVESETPPSRTDVGVLKNVADKLRRASLPNPGSIKYSEVFVEPEELQLISRYTPPKSMVDLGPHVPQFPIIGVPSSRSVNVTVHVKDAERGVVRGVGSLQAQFGMWVRDWALSKIASLVGKVEVSARVGDVVRRAIKPDKTIDHDAVIRDLPGVYDRVHSDAHQATKAQLFVDANVSDDAIVRSGTLGQTIAQEVGATVGQRVNATLRSRVSDLVGDGTVVGDTALPAKTSAIVQRSSEISAGHSQNVRQTFNAFRK